MPRTYTMMIKLRDAASLFGCLQLALKCQLLKQFLMIHGVTHEFNTQKRDCICC